jgi:dTDP-4-amino-4,6-dideoxygalactose transaminase
VNLPPGAFGLLLRSIIGKTVQEGPALDEFSRRFGDWLGVPYVFGASEGRSAFRLALEALDLEKGKEIIFPVFTFPVIPMVAKLLGYKPVFCDVDPNTFNAGPEHIEPKINKNTGAVLATHIFGQPCPIREVAALTKERRIMLLEDCAHACGVRIDGKQVGTFGDVGVYSFAEGKNMPCFGGGAIATADAAIADRARAILAEAPISGTNIIVKKALNIWIKWLVTRPLVFGLTAYQALRLKLILGKPLMDSAVGDELLVKFARSNPHTMRMANLQAALGLLQIRHIDAFNEGARWNARILTENMGDVPDVRPPHTLREDHVYVYYPLTVAAEKRDDLRKFLLRHGVDTKITDMSDCTRLEPFQDGTERRPEPGISREAAILEICVYPVISKRQMKRIARLIRLWAGLSDSPD